MILTLPSCPGFHVKTASSVLESCALSSAYIVSCWSVVFGSRHSCLEFRFVTGFGHSRSIFCHCVSARSRVRSAPRTLVHVCFVVLHAVRVSMLRAFMLCLVLCGSQLVFFIGCVLSCFHVLCEHVAYQFSH